MKVADYVDIAMGSLAPSTQRGWSTYARLIKTLWGDRELSDVHKTDVEKAARQVKDDAMRRAVSLEGVGAQRGFISCCRAVWSRAVDDQLCPVNPAALVKMPSRRRTASARRALNNEELVTVQTVLAQSSDPLLALLVFRICLETGARRNELLGLSTRSLTTSAYGPTIVIAKGAKNQSVRSLPITDTLAAHIGQMAEQRIGPDWQKQDVPLLRNKRGQHITHRWLEYQAVKVRRYDPALGSTSELYFTWHLLRHTAATMIEHAGGLAAAQHFLGHVPSGGGATSVTLGYTKPSQEYLRKCLEAIWEPDKAAARRAHERRQTVVRQVLWDHDQHQPVAAVDADDLPF
ncbi:MAG: site-specific integrase [Candidatus Nanopelagicales bacterium]